MNFNLFVVITGAKRLIIQFKTKIITLFFDRQPDIIRSQYYMILHKNNEHTSKYQHTYLQLI